jgi:hypothetical protein
MHTLFRGGWRSETRFLPRNLVSLILLLSIAIAGCRERVGPDKGPSYPDPKSTPAPYTAYLPGVSSGSALATPTVPSILPSPVPGEEPPPSPTPLPPPVPKPGYGVQIHLFAGDVDETLRWAEGLGVGWVKQWVAWDTVEHEPGNFEWEPLDRAVEACNERGFKLLITVVNAPDWTRPSEPGSGVPADYAEFGRFMGQLASRYRGRVAAYELWNEANLAREWRGDMLDPARFVAYVAAGAEGVRAADPDALIISGAPAVTGIDDGTVAIDDRVFMRGMYEAGVAQWVDGIGAHPYGFANPPGASWQDATHVSSSHNDHPSFFFRDTLEDYHAIMLDHGDTERQIWVTEFGWPSTEGMGPMDVTGWEYGREVSEAQQADYIVRAFRMGDERPWVGPMFLWNLNLATIWGSRNPTSAYSLLRPDRSYRPAYVALRLAEPLAP